MPCMYWCSWQTKEEGILGNRATWGWKILMWVLRMSLWPPGKQPCTGLLRTFDCTFDRVLDPFLFSFILPLQKAPLMFSRLERNWRQTTTWNCSYNYNFTHRGYGLRWTFLIFFLDHSFQLFWWSIQVYKIHFTHMCVCMCVITYILENIGLKDFLC